MRGNRSYFKKERAPKYKWRKAEQRSVGKGEPTQLSGQHTYHAFLITRASSLTTLIFAALMFFLKRHAFRHPSEFR